jgi:hypothetical protein
MPEVQCNDISAGGFSFLAADRPASDRVVVALGVAPRVAYLIAQIAHSTQFEQDGKTMFMVGCNYIGRAVYE